LLLEKKFVDGFYKGKYTHILLPSHASKLVTDFYYSLLIQPVTAILQSPQVRVVTGDAYFVCFWFF